MFLHILLWKIVQHCDCSTTKKQQKSPCCRFFCYGVIRFLRLKALSLKTQKSRYQLVMWNDYFAYEIHRKYSLHIYLFVQSLFLNLSRIVYGYFKFNACQNFSCIPRWRGLGVVSFGSNNSLLYSRPYVRVSIDICSHVYS